MSSPFKSSSAAGVGWVLLALCMLCGHAVTAATTVSQESPASWTSYISPGGAAGTLMNEPGWRDGDWSTYTQALSNGSHSEAIVFNAEETWNIPSGTSNPSLNFKIQSSGAWETSNRVYLKNLTTSAWDRVWYNLDTAGTYNTSVPIPSQYISLSGQIQTKVDLFDKHSTAAWSRLYETSLTYDVSDPPQPPDPVIPGPITPIPPNPEKRNVVIVTHGINDRADGGWPQAAGMSISAQADSTWACDWYDWRDNAESPVPPLIGNMALARYEGQRLGEALLSGDRSWDHVHLIGHSLGAFVISSAARYIEEHKPGTNMHLTFLDPYILNHVTLMNDLDFVQSKAGQYWSDNYFVKDLTGAFTEGSSQYCHNVDLSNIMPNILWPFDYQHNWVHDWYQETIDAWPGPGVPEYGYARSLEASLVSWNANLRGDYPLGNMSPVKPEKTKQGAWAWLASIVSPSITGTVTVDENGLGLGTGSPVWASMLLVLEEEDNYIQFQYQFNGIGEGFLSVYLNDQLILLGDERLDDGELCDSGSIYIGELLEDVNWLSFRLDPLDDDPAGIWISDIEYGHVTPEPATAALLALGALGMLLRHRRKV